jgi:hypothetical protein
VQAPEHQEIQVAFVSVCAGGTIGVNLVAYQMLGRPEAVRLMFDERWRRIALKPTSRDDKKGFFFRYPNESVSIPCKKFLEHYGVPLAETRRYTLHVIDRVLVIVL